MSKRHQVYLTVSFLLLASALIAQNPILVTPQNLEEKAMDIYQDYTLRTGIEYEEVYNFLSSQFRADKVYDDNLNHPVAYLTDHTSDGLFYRWDSTGFKANAFNSAFLDMNRQESGEVEDGKPGSVLCRVSYEYHMLAFSTYKSTFSDQKQSKLYIIIIDRDAFLTCRGNSGFDSDNGLLPPASPARQLTASPNLVHNSTDVLFQLSSSSETSLSVYAVQTGQLISRPIDNARLEKGTHRYEVDLSGLPAGVYLCSLRVGDTVENIKLIKS